MEFIMSTWLDIFTLSLFLSFSRYTEMKKYYLWYSLLITPINWVSNAGYKPKCRRLKMKNEWNLSVGIKSICFHSKFVNGFLEIEFCIHRQFWYKLDCFVDWVADMNEWVHLKIDKHLSRLSLAQPDRVSWIKSLFNLHEIQFNLFRNFHSKDGFFIISPKQLYNISYC